MLRAAVVAVLALGLGTDGFAPSLNKGRHNAPLLRMAEKEDPTLMKSTLKKQIAYDEKSGRFFETNINEEDCVPEEEFCMTDNESGELIRLTQEEKERIFLDALQVRVPRRDRRTICRDWHVRVWKILHWESFIYRRTTARGVRC